MAEPKGTLRSVGDQLSRVADAYETEGTPTEDTSFAPEAPTESEADAPAPESAPEKAEAESPATPTTRTVKVGDEELPEEEVIKGYLRQKDYTQKTQAVAEERRNVEARMRELDDARRARDAYAERLGALDQTLEALKPAEEDLASLKASDPATYAARIAERVDLDKKQEKVRAERGRVEQERYAEHLNAERGRLLSAVPEWKNPETFAKENASLLAFGRSRGFTDAELASVTDHRAILLLRDAARYQELATTKPGKPAPAKAPVLKPGASTPRAPSNKADDAMRRLQKTGRMDDARNAIFALLEQDGAA